MTDMEIFEGAAYWACTRRVWLRAAELGNAEYTRRQCLHRARQAEARVVNYAIRAELRAEHQARMAAA